MKVHVDVLFAVDNHDLSGVLRILQLHRANGMTHHCQSLEARFIEDGVKFGAAEVVVDLNKLVAFGRSTAFLASSSPLMEKKRGSTGGFPSTKKAA
jgi:hypothetical protein